MITTPLFRHRNRWIEERFWFRPPATRLVPLLFVLIFPVVFSRVSWGQIPNLAYRTIETPHFRITFAPGLEPLARHCSKGAETAYAGLSELLVAPPRGKIELLLTDHTDQVNGYANPFPGNRIVLFAQPPTDHESLMFCGDWMNQVVTHELTHIFHLDRAGRIGRALRRLLGRPPLAWPLFPSFGTPNWNIEGITVYHESLLTGSGRIQGTFHDMVVRTAVLEGKFDPVDRAGFLCPPWPGASRHYIYGSLFVDYLARTYGRDVEKRMVARTAASVIPAPLAFDRVGRKVLGRSFTRAWGDWKRELEAGTARLADSLRALGLTQVEELTTSGYEARFPRVSSDGGTVVFAADDGRTDSCTRLLDLASGKTRDLCRRNSLNASCWRADGKSLLISQYEDVDPYQIRQDLYLISPEGKERALTHGMRLQDPDISPDGRTAVAVMNEKGTNRLVLFDLASRTLQALTDLRADVQWAFPRWDPEGRRIAVSRWEAGNYDVAILSPSGMVIRRLTEDRALDTAPAWSPDGRYVVFSSDRNGIPNLYAADLSAADPTSSPPELRQITNLLTGAFYPDISRDQRWIYFSLYRADGFHIARVPFRPDQWSVASPLHPRFAPIPLIDGMRSDLPFVTDGVTAVPASGVGRFPALPASGAVGIPAAPASGVGLVGTHLGLESGSQASRPYGPLHSLLQHSWWPVWQQDATLGGFYGLQIWGEDLVGRHSYSTWFSVNPNQPRMMGAVTYGYAGLGMPVLSVGGSRIFDTTWERSQAGLWWEAIERESSLSLSAALWRPRFRSYRWLNLGLEYTERDCSFISGVPGPMRDPRDIYFGAVSRFGFSTIRTNPFSVGPDGGLSLGLTGRRRWEIHPESESDQTYTEMLGTLNVYEGFPLFGFARHVIAGQLRGLWRGGPGATSTSIGGVSGGAVDLIATTVGGGGSTYPIRGFPSGIRYGSRLWSAGLEYRIPLLLVDRGYHLVPALLDRVSASAFVDAGDAWYRGPSGSYQRGGTGVDGAGRSLTPTPLVGAGGELNVSLVFFGELSILLRIGVGLPVRGPGQGAQTYITVGRSF